ncbi:MAG: HAD family hydrolase [Phycisphaerae bacterium]
MPRDAVVFDLDGTLTRPYLDFDAIRAELGVEGPVLEAIDRMDEAARRRATTVLLGHEHRAAHNVSLRDGAVEIVRACRAAGLGVAILTRNSAATVSIVMDRFSLRVDAVRTREDGAVKPSAEPVLSLCRELDAAPERSWMVGDFLFDIQSGRAAGLRTVLIVDGPRPDYADQADHVIGRLDELRTILGI